MKPSAVNYINDLIKRHPELVDISPSITNAAQAIIDCARSGGKVLICGNGGSAADGDHMVGELMKGFVLPRRLSEPDIQKIRDAGFEDYKELASCLQQGIPAICLNNHPALSSAILSDNGPYIGFAQQTYVYGKPGDVIIGLSTSGNARNVCAALKIGKSFGLRTIGLTGNCPSEMDDICEIMIKAPVSETFRVQEYHLPIYHTLCLMVEEEIFGE